MIIMINILLLLLNYLYSTFLNKVTKCFTKEAKQTKTTGIIKGEYRVDTAILKSIRNVTGSLCKLATLWCNMFMKPGTI